MTAPMTPNDVAAALARTARLLSAAQEELTEADEAAVRARHRYELAFARAFLGGEGSVDSRKQAAVLTCDLEKLTAEVADSKVRSLRSRISVLRSQVEVSRSLGAGMRSEWAATV